MSTSEKARRAEELRPGLSAWSGSAAMSALVAATFVQAASMVSDQGIPLLLPFIKSDLSLSLPAAALLVTMMGFGRLLASLPVGHLVDRVGSRAVLTGTSIGLALFLGLAAPVHAAPLLVGAGAATAGTTSAGAALVAQAFGARRGLAMGIRQSGVPLGGLAAAFLMPWLAHASSWHWAVAASAVIALSGALVVHLLTANLKEARLAIPRLTLRSLVEPLHSRPLVAVFLWGAVFVMAQYAFIALVPVQEGSLGIGVMMVVLAQIGGIVGRPGWGLFSDLIGGRRRATLLLISGVGAVSCVLVAIVPSSASPLLLATSAVVFGLGAIGWQGLWATSIAEVAGVGAAGSALGFGQLFIQVGIMGGPALVALIAGTPGGFRLAWIALAGALTVASVPLALIRAWPGEEARRPAR